MKQVISQCTPRAPEMLGAQLCRRFAPVTGILIAKGANLIAIEAKDKEANG